MNRELIIIKIPHIELLKIFIPFATRELGQIKINEILSKVNSSNKVGRFLQEAQRINKPLGSDDYLGCLHSSTSFMFASPETLAVAAITLLMKWDHKIGRPNSLSNDIHLNERFFTLLDKCAGFKIHLNAGSTFFERFNDYLNEEANRFINDHDYDW